MSDLVEGWQVLVGALEIGHEVVLVRLLIDVRVVIQAAIGRLDTGLRCLGVA